MLAELGLANFVSIMPNRLIGEYQPSRALVPMQEKIGGTFGVSLGDAGVAVDQQRHGQRMRMIASAGADL
jgi:hypothetical protein